MTWGEVAVLAAIAQGIGTLGAFYLTILLLRQTGRSVETALYDHAARLSPHITVHGRAEMAFGVTGIRMALISQNDGIGPAINVLMVSDKLDQNPKVSASNVSVTSSGGVAILPPGGGAPWTADGSWDDRRVTVPLVIKCRDIEDGEWEFVYTLELPENSGSISAVLQEISRPQRTLGLPIRWRVTNR